MVICLPMLMKDKIDRETHFPLNAQKARQHCNDHDNGLVGFPFSALVLALGGNPFLARKGRYIKDDVVLWGSA